MRSDSESCFSCPHCPHIQRLFICLAGTVIRLRFMALVLGVGAGAVGIAVVGVVAVVVIAAIFRTLNFGNDVGLLVSLFFSALGALHTLFCHSYHLGISVALDIAKNTRKNLMKKYETAVCYKINLPLEGKGDRVSGG